MIHKLEEIIKILIVFFIILVLGSILESFNLPKENSLTLWYFRILGVLIGGLLGITLFYKNE